MFQAIRSFGAYGVCQVVKVAAVLAVKELADSIAKECVLTLVSGAFYGSLGSVDRGVDTALHEMN
jgi:hypothetical protein